MSAEQRIEGLGGEGPDGVDRQGRDLLQERKQGRANRTGIEVAVGPPAAEASPRSRHLCHGFIASHVCILGRGV
jgi:hypothetical protein